MASFDSLGSSRKFISLIHKVIDHSFAGLCWFVWYIIPLGNIQPDRSTTILVSDSYSKTFFGILFDSEFRNIQMTMCTSMMRSYAINRDEMFSCFIVWCVYRIVNIIVCNMCFTLIKSSSTTSVKILCLCLSCRSTNTFSENG